MAYSLPSAGLNLHNHSAAATHTERHSTTLLAMASFTHTHTHTHTHRLIEAAILLRQSMSRAGNDTNELWYRVQEVDHLRNEEQQQGLAEVT